MQIVSFFIFINLIGGGSIVPLTVNLKKGAHMEFNPSTLLEAALQQGSWAALYIYLFFRMLKENATREERYQAMIDRLSGKDAQGKRHP